MNELMIGATESRMGDGRELCCAVARTKRR